MRALATTLPTPESERVTYVQEGLRAIDEAIALKRDYFEALTYKNLLLRVQAKYEKNPARQQELLLEANRWRDEAQELRILTRPN